MKTVALRASTSVAVDRRDLDRSQVDELYERRHGAWPHHEFQPDRPSGPPIEPADPATVEWSAMMEPKPFNEGAWLAQSLEEIRAAAERRRQEMDREITLLFPEANAYQREIIENLCGRYTIGVHTLKAILYELKGLV